jgi:hypothetical protein
MANTENTSKKLTLVVSGWAMLLFAPIALLGIVYPVNHYQAIGTEGAVDCDGPLGVLLLAIPSLIVYVKGFIAFARSVRFRRGVVNICMVVLSACVCFGLISNSVAAAIEHNSQAHQEVCGRGL